MKRSFGEGKASMLFSTIPSAGTPPGVVASSSATLPREGEIRAAFTVSEPSFVSMDLATNTPQVLLPDTLKFEKKV